MLIVEQNANLVLEFADAAHVLETGRVVLSGTADEVSAGRVDAQGLPGVLMERFIETLIDGIATGSIYGALALALVLIYRSTGIVNFAQGEMAMFSTFVAWGLTEAGLAGRASRCWSRSSLSLLGGMLIERALIRPVEGWPGADAGDRHARPVHPRQRPRALDLGLDQPRLPEPVPGRHRRPSAGSTRASSRSGWSPCCSASSACCG